jgi:hypothetical protein
MLAKAAGESSLTGIHDMEKRKEPWKSPADFPKAGAATRRYCEIASLSAVSGQYDPTSERLKQFVRYLLQL